MKVFCFFTLVALAATSVPVEETREHGENGWYVLQQDETSKWVSLAEWKREKENFKLNLKERGGQVDQVKFYLYTNENPIKAQRINASTNRIEKLNFNSRIPTRFIIHGWQQNYTAETNGYIRDAWLSTGDYNIIAVDWAKARDWTYIPAVVAVPEVGVAVAQMIDFLVENFNMSLSSLIVIGFSLGAHVAGFAGKNTKKGQINTIVGLDPALPLFRYNIPKERLSATDAFYVEIIHSNGGYFGFLKPIGRSDFYPNGGKIQPGCNNGIICSHSRSAIYYSEAVRNNNFPAIKCDDYKEAVQKNCGSSFSRVRMGAKANARKAGGIFYVPIKNESQFDMDALK